MAVAKHQMADRIQIVQRLRKMIAFTDQAGEGMPSTYTGHYGATVVDGRFALLSKTHHALVDGRQVGEFFAGVQAALDGL